MMRTMVELLAAVTAFGATAAFGWQAQRLAQHKDADEQTMWPPSAINAKPLYSGLAAGAGILALLSPWISSGDRFYSAGQSFTICVAIICCGALIMCSHFVETKVARLALELLAAIAAVLAGVRFPVLGVGSGKAFELGSWAAPLTVLWLVLATNIVKLLEGLEGGAPSLLLATALAVFVSTAGNNEYLLNGISAVVIGASASSLRFHFYPAKVPLRGGGTALAGFYFALLTTLARQKTVTALLFILPLALLILFVGGTMIAFLARNLKPGDDVDE